MHRNLTAFAVAVVLLVGMYLAGYFDTPGGVTGGGLIAALQRHQAAGEGPASLEPPVHLRRRLPSGGFAASSVPVPFECSTEAIVQRLVDEGVVKRPTMEELQARRRIALREQGFTAEYIDMVVRAMDRRLVTEPLREAERCLQAGRYDTAISVLDEALAHVDASNLLLQHELLGLYLRAHLLSNRLIRAEDVSLRFFQICERILTVKAGTPKLMQQSWERAAVERDLPLVRQFLATHAETFTQMRERHQRTGSWNGLLPEELERSRTAYRQAHTTGGLSAERYTQAIRCLDRGHFGPVPTGDTPQEER